MVSYLRFSRVTETVKDFYLQDAFKMIASLPVYNSIRSSYAKVELFLTWDGNV